MAEKWKLTGDWMNSCNCDPGCPCLYWSDPTSGHCDAIDTFHIRKGNYGKTKLDGLNVVLASKVPGNFWKGNWKVAVYFDNRANDDQKKALETLFGGKAGGPLEQIAKLIGEVVGTKWSEIKLDPAHRTAEIPGILKFSLEPNLGGDQKTPITVSNHPMAPGFGPMALGKGTSSTYNDFGWSINNTGKDANWSTFDLKGP